MFFSRAEIEVLALCALCKDLPVNGCRNIPDNVLAPLVDHSFIRISKNGMGYRITPTGIDILKRAEINLLQDKTYLSNSDKLLRRMNTAEIAVFFWRYGADIFVKSTTAESADNVFLPSFTLRRQPVANILGGSRLTGFYYTPETVFIPYYITKDNKGFYPNVEQRIFYAEALSLKRKPHILYTGEGNLEQIIGTVATHREKPKKNTADYFDDAITKFSCPLAIMPLTEDGMRQLRIMAVPGYKQIIVKNLLGKKYLPPVSPQFDGRDKAENYVIGIDCNIKRFEAVIKSGEAARLFVLPFQVNAVQKMVEGTNVSCYFLNLTETEIALGISKPLPPIRDYPFKTEKGININVPLIGKIKNIRG